MVEYSDDERSFYAMKVALHLSDEAKSIETLEDVTDMDLEKVRAGLEGLMERDLITSTPSWEYRRAR